MGTILRLNVKMLTGGQYSLDASATQTVWDFKVQAGRKLGLTPYQLKLASQNSMVSLEDSAPLSQYGLMSGDTVVLMVKEEEPICILLKNQQGRSCTYNVMPSMLVDEFRARVAQQEQVSVHQFWLTYQGAPLEDGHKMSEYNIVPHTTVFMNMRLRGG